MSFILRGIPAGLRRWGVFAAASLLALVFAGCAAKPPMQDTSEVQEPDVEVVAESEPREPPPQSGLPAQDLNETTLYEFLLAEIAAQRGNVGVAAQAYVDLAKRTRDPRVARRATEMAAHARLSGPAIEAAQVWYEVEPKSQRALQTLINLLVNSARFDEAMPLLKKAMAEGTANPAEAFTQINRTVANAQDKGAALRLIRALGEAYPNLPQARFAVAQAAANAREDDLALAEVRKAAALRPDWENAALLEAQVLQRKSAQAAITSLSRFLQKYPKSRDVRLTYARLLVTEKRYVDARGEFQALLAEFPNNTDVVFAVALLSLQLNDYSIAETNLKRLLTSNYRDKNSVRLYLGQIAEEQKKLPEALQWYGEIGEGEQYVPAQIRYAQVLAKDGKLDAARARLQRAGGAQGGQQRVQFILAEAQLLREANQAGAAFDMVSDALEKLPNQPDLLYDHAMLAEKIERMDILEASLRKLIALRPDHAHAYNALGYSLAERNVRLPEARELIEKALKLAPEDFFIVDSMGWVLYRLGETKTALGWLQRAFAGRPDPEIAAHLGEVLWALGRRDEAERVLREAAQKNPDNESLPSTLKRLKQ